MADETDVRPEVPYDDQADRGERYDEMVDWSKRLGRELPFFRRIFDEAGVKRIADVGCGSGRHAVAFAREGYDVVGIDPSLGMLAQAQEVARAAGVAVPFMQGAFGGVTSIVRRAFGDTVDAVITLGNGLPHVDGIMGARLTFTDFAAALRPGGVLVLHLLNHARLQHARPASLPAKVNRASDGRIVVVLRILDYTDEGLVIEFVQLARDARVVEPTRANAFIDSDQSTAEWGMVTRRSLHTWLTAETLETELERAGFEGVEVFGDHSGRPLDLEKDESVIVVARRTQP
jgi:SAM-dependent methyltransferase